MSHSPRRPRRRAACSSSLEHIAHDDPWTYHLTNERWQVVAKSDAGSPAPKAPAPADFESVTLYHAAGVGGTGSSSYSDSMILLEEDTTATGLFDRRTYYVQNWRHDVAAVTEADGDVKSMMGYTAYGEPVETMRADLDKDGDVDFGDFSIYAFQSGTADCAGSGAHGCTADFDRDGDVDGDDTNIFSAENGDTFAGRLGVLSSSTGGRGYAGHLHDASIDPSLQYMRARMYDSSQGRFLTPDPLGNIDSASRYAYVGGEPVRFTDPSGKCRSCSGPGILLDRNPVRMPVSVPTQCKTGPGLCGSDIMIANRKPKKPKKPKKKLPEIDEISCTSVLLTLIIATMPEDCRTKRLTKIETAAARCCARGRNNPKTMRSCLKDILDEHKDCIVEELDFEEIMDELVDINIDTGLSCFEECDISYMLLALGCATKNFWTPFGLTACMADARSKHLDCYGCCAPLLDPPNVDSPCNEEYF